MTARELKTIIPCCQREPAVAGVTRATLTFEEWRRIMRVNLDGLYLMCRASSDVMRSKGFQS